MRTFQQVKESITQKPDISTGARYDAFSFSYKNSQQASYMIDKMVQENVTTMFTTAQIAYVKLSMFEPSMELSDNFRYVIDYISDLLLGGIAQQNLYMKLS